MAQPYSEDFRRKVIAAIEMNGLKKSEASELFDISRNTIIYGYSARLKQEISSRKRGRDRVKQAKLRIGQHFEPLSTSIKTKPKPRWQPFGRLPLASERYREPCRRLTLRGKSGATLRRRTALRNAHQDKNVWVPRTGPRETSSILR